MIPGIPAHHCQAVERRALTRPKPGLGGDLEAQSIRLLGGLEVVLGPGGHAEHLERPAGSSTITESPVDRERLFRMPTAGAWLARANGERRQTDKRAGAFHGRRRWPVEDPTERTSALGQVAVPQPRL